jgi:hypothetical protein
MEDGLEKWPIGCPEEVSDEEPMQEVESKQRDLVPLTTTEKLALVVLWTQQERLGASIDEYSDEERATLWKAYRQQPKRMRVIVRAKPEDMTIEHRNQLIRKAMTMGEAIHLMTESPHLRYRWTIKPKLNMTNVLIEHLSEQDAQGLLTEVRECDHGLVRVRGTTTIADECHEKECERERKEESKERSGEKRKRSDGNRQPSPVRYMPNMHRYKIDTPFGHLFKLETPRGHTHYEMTTKTLHTGCDHGVVRVAGERILPNECHRSFCLKQAHELIKHTKQNRE